MTDRNRINQTQRQRRAAQTRIDYTNVSNEARQIIDSLRDGSINGTAGAILNRIVIEWGMRNGYQTQTH